MGYLAKTPMFLSSGRLGMEDLAIRSVWWVRLVVAMEKSWLSLSGAWVVWGVLVLCIGVVGAARCGMGRKGSVFPRAIRLSKSSAHWGGVCG